ncbi:nitrilase-related carbon-nitrogen hydrolase, partial [Candidatus Pelagibacter communis]|uniref:nitrilase-related carbon-nitrogen hydrolase n=1 Tax=Pelagibacter ubique TaxID=198252 RepID=UPI000AEF9F3C
MKVAVIQHPPKYLNLQKTIDLGVELIETAAGQGSKLVVFPEAWFPGYPEYVWRLKPGGEM